MYTRGTEGCLCGKESEGRVNGESEECGGISRRIETHYAIWRIRTDCNGVILEDISTSTIYINRSSDCLSISPL